MTTPEPTRIRIDRPEPGIFRVTLARPEAKNAQDKRMIYEVNAAFEAAVTDPETKVIVVAADGTDFSSGHDVRDAEPVTAFERTSSWGEFDRPGAEGYLAYERELYLDMCWRWRNLPKPIIAQVHGRCMAGGLMLVWPADMIVASDDATFSDPVLAFDMNGVEYFTHAWEFGPRKAKEMLMTGRAISAAAAHRLGMVNHVVARDQLEAETLTLAREVAAQPLFALKLAKLSVNASLDAQGQHQAMMHAFALHQLGHTHNRLVHGKLVDPAGLERIRELGKQAVRE